MIDQKLERKFLKWLHEEYVRRYGYGVRNIDKCTFYLTRRCDSLPEDFYSVDNGVATSKLLHFAEELAAKGLVRFGDTGLDYYFTKEGYQAASQGFWGKTLDSLNKNPGLWAVSAILISIGSLIVSILDLK
ncbi:hypothetical protein ACNKU7_16485 [Microbulbifer sp. SA54]|uniref:hypothetical protein n=1 Tax=Microbulbifer sp. SA54 TaxID=3401577 RepID=UPI003AAD2CEB